MKSRFIVAVGTLIAVFVAGPVYAAKCSNSAKGFERFKKDFARDARAAGIGRRGLSALASARYSTKVIKYDRRINRPVQIGCQEEQF